MSEPRNPQELPQLLRLRAPIVRQRPILAPDAINETLASSRYPQVIEGRRATIEGIPMSKPTTSTPPPPPQIGPANPLWNYPDETRRALGYYTQEEREQAARMNDMRSASLLNTIMPNFGRNAAYNNPGAELDAIRQTALYVPEAILAGSSFGLPSATEAVIQGARTGWRGARAAGSNLGRSAIAATTNAARQVTPIIADPRQAATIAMFTTPLAAAANDGNYVETALTLGIPTALGIGVWKGAKWLKGKWNGTPPTSPASVDPSQYVYKRSLNPLSLEHPSDWERIRRNALYTERHRTMTNEWNTAAGNPELERAFISKYNIRSKTGVPQFEEEKYTVPRMIREPRMVEKQVPRTNTVSVFNGNTGRSEKYEIEVPGEMVTQRVPVTDKRGRTLYTRRQAIGEDGKPIVDTRTRIVPKKGKDGKQIIEYDPISPERVPDFLRNPNALPYTSDFLNTNSIIFTGPTESQRNWMRLRNAGRVATWFSPLGLGYSVLSTPSEEPSSNASLNNPDVVHDINPEDTDTLRLVTPQYTDDGHIILPNNSGGRDTIQLIHYPAH